MKTVKYSLTVYGSESRGWCGNLLCIGVQCCLWYIAYRHIRIPALWVPRRNLKVVLGHCYGMVAVRLGSVLDDKENGDE